MKEGQHQQTFLVAYDYGQGGAWAEIRAESAEQIQTLYPCLEVVEEKPGWMDESARERLPHARLGNPNDPFLRELPCQPMYEDPDADFVVSKGNRHSNQVAESGREGYHPFKRVQHAPDRKALQRRAYQRERKAIKRR